MAASSRAIISRAERRFPLRVRIAVPLGGFGQQLDAMHAWLNQNCGADGWLMTAAGLRGLVNDAGAIYFPDAALAAAFVSRWCRQRLPDRADGAFGVRDDDPAPRGPPRAFTERHRREAKLLDAFRLTQEARQSPTRC